MSLVKALGELTSKQARLSTGLLSELSCLTAEEMREFSVAWASASAERRGKVLRQLAELAEDTVELDFTAVYRHALADENDDVRVAAVVGLWECEERSLISPLVGLLNDDPSELVRSAAAQALGRFALLTEVGKLLEIDRQRIGDALLLVIDNEFETLDVRRRAIEAIAPMSHPRVPEIVQEAYEHEDPKVRASALFAMGRTCDLRWLPVLIGALENEDPELRYEAASGLGELGEEDAVIDLIPMIDDGDELVQEAVLNALGAIGGAAAKRALLRVAEGDDPRATEIARNAQQSIEFEEDPLDLNPES